MNKLSSLIQRLRRAVLIISLLFVSSCRGREPADIKVLATTSLISTIVSEIGRERVEVFTLVPGGMCPGHFDLKPSDIVKASKAELLLTHGWEPWMEELLKSCGERRPATGALKTQGNWMVPPVHLGAVQEIAHLLSTIDPDHAEFYRKHGNQYADTVEHEARRILESSKSVKRPKALSSDHQREFLEWLGLEVVGTYGRPEERTATEMVELIRLAKREGVKLVVDNLQTGPNAGLGISQEIGAEHLVLTNFPLENSYIESLRDNFEKIRRAIE